ALGAAYLAGLAVGYWKNEEDIQEQWQLNKQFEPALDDATRTKLVDGWKKAVSATIAWSITS
ncbi:MAG: glycerol kinase, partial [Ferruginibacter sp.]